MLRLCNRLKWVSSGNCEHVVPMGRYNVASELKTAYGTFPSFFMLSTQNERCFRRNTLYLASSLAAQPLCIVSNQHGHEAPNMSFAARRSGCEAHATTGRPGCITRWFK